MKSKAPLPIQTKASTFAPPSQKHTLNPKLFVLHLITRPLTLTLTPWLEPQPFEECRPHSPRSSLSWAASTPLGAVCRPSGSSNGCGTRLRARESSSISLTMMMLAIMNMRFVKEVYIYICICVCAYTRNSMNEDMRRRCQKSRWRRWMRDIYTGSMLGILYTFWDMGFLIFM